MASIRITARHTDVVLRLLLATSFSTGVGSWLVPTTQAGPIIVVHAVSGLALVVLGPLKIGGSVRTGMRRRRSSRFASTAYGVLILSGIGLGVLHATGLWAGVGYWSSLWTHLLFGFMALPITVWHIFSRPSRPSVTDLDRRALLTSVLATSAAAGLLIVQESVGRRLGLRGASRAGTGSHPVASFDPRAMPVVSWINDRAPDLDLDAWPLRVFGHDTAPSTLAEMTMPMRAVLDCTGGWYSEQDWHVVSLAAVLAAVDPHSSGDPPGAESARSVSVQSATGYSRLFPMDDLDDVYLATGYGDQSLSSGHGAPVRIVAPGRRGPWWVKWVTEVEISDRPAWAQLPLPAD